MNEAGLNLSGRVRVQLFGSSGKSLILMTSLLLLWLVSGHISSSSVEILPCSTLKTALGHSHRLMRLKEDSRSLKESQTLREETDDAS